MELCEHLNLEKIIKSRQDSDLYNNDFGYKVLYFFTGIEIGIDREENYIIFESIVSGLRVFHDLGIIHGDI